MKLARTAAWLLVCACACGPSGDSRGESAAEDAARAAQARISQVPHDVAVLDLGELGAIRVELLPELAPRTVAEFIELAERGFYDGTHFHRVMPGFMIQGGDPQSKNKDPRDDGTGDSDERLPDEFSGYPHVRGTVSLANKGGRNSGSCQFFIVHQDSRHLDGKYSAFGRVSDGIETVDAVTRLPIDLYGRYGPRNRPYPQDAVIRSVRIERASSPATPSEPLAAAAPSG